MRSPSEPRPSTEARLVQLDAMRGIAALMVVAYHYTTRFPKLYGTAPATQGGFSLGHYGVEWFFMISGFVIFMTLERTGDSRDFIVSRFARLYPAYWACVLLTTVTLWLSPLPGRGVNGVSAVMNLTMLQHWLGYPSADGVYWTLSVELLFYTVMLALFLLRALRRINLICVLWLAAVVLACVGKQVPALRLPPLLIEILQLDYAQLFIAGIMLYRLYRDRESKPSLLIGMGAVAVEYAVRGWEAGLVCTVFFLIFLSVALRMKALDVLLTWRPLVYIGTISYTLYLLHQYIGYVSLRALGSLHIGSMPAIAATFALSLVLASVVSSLVEAPARRAIRNAWKKFRAART